MAPHERDHAHHRETHQNEQNQFRHRFIHPTSAHGRGQMATPASECEPSQDGKVHLENVVVFSYINNESSPQQAAGYRL